MLKTSYTAESEIPENLKGAYVARDGKFVLDDLAEDHPVIVSKKSALADKSKAVSKSEELQADLEAAKSSSIPRGHVAVAKADAELLDKIKEHGTAQEVVTKLTEHKDLKTETERRKREDSLRAVAKELSYEPEAFVRLQNLPEFEIREKDGQKSVIAKIKDDKGVITEKPATEFIESSADFAPFMPALKATGVRVHGSVANSGVPPKGLFDKIRDDAKTKQKQAEKVHPMAMKIPGRTAAPTGE